MKQTGKWYTGLLLLLCSTALFAQPVSYKTLPSGLQYQNSEIELINVSSGK